MNTKVKVIVAALCTAGVIAPQLALADTISAPATPPGAQSVVPGAYTVSYPVVVTLAGGAPQALTFVYNSPTAANPAGTWTAPAGWTYDASLNPNANTAVFTTTSGGTAYGVALSSTGTTQFIPGQTGAVTSPPSVGTAPAGTPVTGTVLPGWGAATATGTITGNGQTTATLVGAGAVAQIIGVGAGGAPVGVAVVGAPIAVAPPTSTSPVGNAGGSVAVSANTPISSVGYGGYTITIPTTNTPNPTASVAGTVAGNGGSFGSTGINIGPITGAASYNPNTGVITATPVFTAGFSVNPSGNTQIGCAGPNGGTTATLTVCNQTFTNGITDTGGIVTFGGLSVGGHTSTTGLSNTGALSTTTLNVTGGTVTNGIVNNGALTTTSLGVAGGAVVNGTLGVAGVTSTSGIVNTGSLSTSSLAVTGATTTNGINNTGAINTTTLGVTGNATIGGSATVAGNSAVSGNSTVGGTLGVTGATTLNGATQINNTLNVTRDTTIGGVSTNTNTLSVTQGGVLINSGGLGGNSIAVNSSGTALVGGGAGLTLANGHATFGGVNGGTPLRVTGIADGQNQYDAVNYGQFQEVEKNLSRGISGATAVANIPQVDQGKTFSLGVGVGGYNGETAVGIGGSVRVAKDGIIKASVGFAGGGSSNTVWGVGGGWNWQ